MIVFEFPVIVVDQSEELVIGNDFLTKFNAVINYAKKKIQLERRDSRFIDVPRIIPFHAKLYLDETLVIPPKCRLIYRLPVPSIQGSFSGLIEPNHKTMKFKNIGIARSLSCIRNGELPIEFTNFKSRSIEIQKGMSLGNLIPYSSDYFYCHAPEMNISAVREEKEVSNEEIDKFFRGFDFSKTRIPKQQMLSLQELLFHYRDVFEENEGSMSSIPSVQHHIELLDPNVTPIREKLRRTTPVQKAVISKEIDDMLANNVIEPSQSPWAAAIHLVKKKDGSVRFCIDFRGLNEITKKDAYPLPRIDDTLDSLAGMCFFSTLDARKGYWQIYMHPADREKTAFVSFRGLYQFKRMPFGLTNAPATFQRLMDFLLAGLLFEICLVYIDDIIVFSRTFDEHLKNLATVFDRLRAANVKLSAKKCFFCQQEINFLGHVISSEGSRPDPEKVKAVQSWPLPTSVSTNRGFLGLVGYYRRFIPDFATIAEPLTSMTSRYATFSWDTAKEEAFQQLKKRLISAPVLHYPDFSKSFTLFTDASDVGLGAVLQQDKNVIAYWSKVLNKAERNYTTTEKECLAFVGALKNFRPYLIGQKFQVITDHSALKWLKNVKEPTSRLMRWCLKLQDYDFDIIHRPGKDHLNADALSRWSFTPEEIAEVSEDIEDNPELNKVLKNLQQAQRLDPVLSKYFPYLEDGILPEDLAESQRILIETKDIILGPDNILYRVFKSRRSEIAQQILIPIKMRPEILALCHDSKLGAHLGFFKTFDRIKERFYWNQMQRDIRNYVMSCQFCNKRKFRRQRKLGKMGRVKGHYPFDIIGVDILGPLPKTANGNRYIVVFIDYFTKYVEAFAIPDQETEVIARKLLDEVVYRYGAPSRIVSDRGSQFTSALLKDLTKIMNTKKVFTTSYHPQTDGLAEKFNQTLATMLTGFLNKPRNDWDEHLRPIVFAYQTVIQASTGYSPAELVFPWRLRLPFNLELLRTVNEDPNELSEFARNELYKLNDAYELAEKAMDKAHERQKTQHDKHKDDHNLQVGDQVYKKIAVPEKGRPKKFQYRYEGPFNVSKIYSEQLIEISHPDDPALRFNTNVEKVFKATPRDPELLQLSHNKEKRERKIVSEEKNNEEIENLDLAFLDSDLTTTPPVQLFKGEPTLEEEGIDVKEIMEHIEYDPEPEVQLRSRRRAKTQLENFYMLKTRLEQFKKEVQVNLSASPYSIRRYLKEILGSGSIFLKTSITREFDKSIAEISSRDQALSFLNDLIDHFNIRFAREIERITTKEKLMQ